MDMAEGDQLHCIFMFVKIFVHIEYVENISSIKGLFQNADWAAPYKRYIMFKHEVHGIAVQLMKCFHLNCSGTVLLLYPFNFYQADAIVKDLHFSAAFSGIDQYILPEPNDAVSLEVLSVLDRLEEGADLLICHSS